jgi:hypothetical protein
MKIATLALLALGLADAKKGRKFNKKAFLRNVVKEGKRRLENEDEQLISADESVKFHNCLTVTLGPSDETGEVLFDENNLQYTKAGTLACTKDVVMFFKCTTGSCYYDGNSDDLFMMPLADWLENTYNYQIEKDAAYCEACEQSQDFCQ